MHRLRLRPPRHAGPLPRMRRVPRGRERSDDMKRLGHWLFLSATIVSLAMLVGSMSISMLSHWRRATFGFGSWSVYAINDYFVIERQIVSDHSPYSAPPSPPRM